MTFDDFDTQIQCDELEPPPWEPSGWETTGGVDSGQPWGVSTPCPMCGIFYTVTVAHGEFDEWFAGRLKPAQMSLTENHRNILEGLPCEACCKNAI